MRPMMPLRHKPRQSRPASLALRVTALVGIATTLVFLVFNWVILRSLEHHFAQQDAHELEAVTAALAQPLHQLASDIAIDELKQHLANAVAGHHGMTYGVYDGSGNGIYATPGPDLSKLASSKKLVNRITADDLIVWQEDQRSYRGVVIQLPADDSAAPGYRIVAAMDIGFHLDFLAEFKRMLWWATGLVMCLALGVAWLAVQWGHLPIRKVNEEIRAIRSSKLDVRLDPRDVPIELAELVFAFNDMLARIEEGFTRLSHFSADIAHELRTPVTNLVTQTHVALGQPRSNEEYREILYSNLEEFDRMGRMIGDMLFLAQTENDPRNLRLSTIDLSELVRSLFDYFEALAEDSGIALGVKGAIGSMAADREMLTRALNNLLSNAIRHTPRGKSITVLLSQDEQWTTISVVNPGERIPEPDLPKLFNRFYRVDPARQRNTAGAGLGLAIVKSIAEAHGGSVAVTSSELVTRFDLVLPHLRQ
ncbi:TPA: heavy metal sensor histidine kinase [Pseudomonas aeruginosa]|uniref:heavy metal sensor histidine kinase n=1 Tax=Alcaligenes xylosoxydans xylosoxydans TaxID=85698 RepID=UPI0006C8ACE5|nr:heavy metal sensor histidine kinase [Achromobacter xylosoxidans]QCS62056.1 heavy metal sensor histidine kinase [Achromobacter denitrificans]